VTGLLYLAPLLVLAAALLAGRYPGEVLLARMATRRRRSPRVTAARAGGGAPPRGPARIPARGGLLLGRALAGRAPPVVSGRAPRPTNS
jgi:hypothetical protein